MRRMRPLLVASIAAAAGTGLLLAAFGCQSRSSSEIDAKKVTTYPKLSGFRPSSEPLFTGTSPLALEIDESMLAVSGPVPLSSELPAGRILKIQVTGSSRVHEVTATRVADHVGRTCSLPKLRLEREEQFFSALGLTTSQEVYMILPCQSVINADNYDQFFSFPKQTPGQRRDHIESLMETFGVDLETENTEIRREATVYEIQSLLDLPRLAARQIILTVKPGSEEAGPKLRTLSGFLLESAHEVERRTTYKLYPANEVKRKLKNSYKTGEVVAMENMVKTLFAFDDVTTGISINSDYADAWFTLYKGRYQNVFYFLRNKMHGFPVFFDGEPLVVQFDRPPKPTGFSPRSRMTELKLRSDLRKTLDVEQVDFEDPENLCTAVGHTLNKTRDAQQAGTAWGDLAGRSDPEFIAFLKNRIQVFGLALHDVAAELVEKSDQHRFPCGLQL